MSTSQLTMTQTVNSGLRPNGSKGQLWNNVVHLEDMHVKPELMPGETTKKPIVLKPKKNSKWDCG